MAAASEKSQEELEAPVKGYQLEAVAQQVVDLAKQTTIGFKEVKDSLNTLVLKSEGQVTPQQMIDNVTAVRTTLETKIEEEVKKLHLEFDPLKENNKWLIRAIAVQAIIIVGQIVFILYVTKATS